MALTRPTWVFGDDFHFPSPERASRDGVVALGGDVTPRTLRRAYRAGIFPWPVREDLPMFWFSPNPRFVLELDHFHVPRSLAKAMRKDPPEIRFDTAFSDVMSRCARARRDGGGTWIDPRLVRGFVNLHHGPVEDRIRVHSVEAWRHGRLVGGLYGVATGAAFAGESMFFDEPDAGKVALVALVERLRERGFHFLDCQVETENLARFGARNEPRAAFLQRLADARDEDVLLTP